MSIDVDAGRIPPGLHVRLVTMSTALFALMQFVVVVQPHGAVMITSIVWSVALFGWGMGLFVAGFVVAAGRSRDERVTMAGVVWLIDSAPPATARWMRGLLIAQVVIAIGSAACRPFSGVAFGILVPMYGLGALVWQGSRHGTYPSIVPDGGAATVPVEAATRRPTLDGSVDRPPSEPREDPDDFDQLFRRRRKR